MNFRFEATNDKEADEAVEHFYRFHDDYVAEIEIKFEDYKALNDKGESTGIRDARKTIILTVNTRPYGREHEHLVQVEFKDVKSFEISLPQDIGPMWGIGTTMIVPDGVHIKWEFDFVCGDAKFLVVCSNIVLTSDFVRKE